MPITLEMPEGGLHYRLRIGSRHERSQFKAFVSAARAELPVGCPSLTAVESGFA